MDAAVRQRPYTELVDDSVRTISTVSGDEEGARRRPHVLRPLRCSLRRLRRHLLYAVRPPSLRVIYDPVYEGALPGVPFDPLRADRILAFLAEEGLLRREEISRPRRAGLHNLLLAHTPDYLESLQRAETLTQILGVPVASSDIEGLVDHQRMLVGGTIQATRLAIGLDCTAVNLGGGLHHARGSRGGGFCIFNDLAVAVRRLRRKGFHKPILIVDLDLHDGNGTRELFADDDSVWTFSIHNEHWGDTEAVASTSIALGPDVGDELFLGTLLKALPPLFESFDPGLLIYLAGCDGAADDAIGNWNLTADALLARDRLVCNLARNRGISLAVVLGGGYGEHAWRYTARMVAWLLAGKVVEPPSNEELTLMRFRQIKRRMDEEQSGAEGEDSSLLLTEEDLVGILPGIPRQTRFLGYYTKVGLELLLERFGILSQLRARGFPSPELELDLAHPLGHTLRLWGAAGRRDLLVELRVARSTRELPGMEVLNVEWLLLQNPRKAFTADRPPLPGQSHPGLGLLPEFFGWLLVLGESLDLDGLAFHTSHYHIAALSVRFARFLEPEHEALFRAIERAVADLPLAEASAAVEAGTVVDTATGTPVRWPGPAMVLPVSDDLKARFEDADYRRRVTEAEHGFELRLATAATT